MTQETFKIHGYPKSERSKEVDAKKKRRAKLRKENFKDGKPSGKAKSINFVLSTIKHNHKSIYSKIILTKLEKEFVNELPLEVKVNIKTVGNKAIKFMSAFETCWRSKNTTKWDNELFAVMSSMLLELCEDIFIGQQAGRWPALFNSDNENTNLEGKHHGQE